MTVCTKKSENYFVTFTHSFVFKNEKFAFHVDVINKHKMRIRVYLTNCFCVSDRKQHILYLFYFRIIDMYGFLLNFFVVFCLSEL